MKVLWTDGSAIPNPGKGGFAVIEVKDNKGYPVILGNDKYTTNIKMEGQALISAIEYAGSENCEIHTDSEFWVNVLTKWAPTWELNGWRKKSGPIKNLDLVQKLYSLYRTHNVTLKWTRGHIGTKYNEMADEWAEKARTGVKLPNQN
ncbi:ribonuclease HI [Candidatus Saccharibacteria bacterium]|nr:ribonuclease HI [Candidatus Saccharibacteria bacterium]